MTVDPDQIELLKPGQSVDVLVTVQSDVSDPGGDYTGDILIAELFVDGYSTVVGFSVRLNNGAQINVPIETIIAFVGESISIPLTGFDADGDDVDYSIWSAPAGAMLVPSADPNTFTFEWQPGPKDTGNHEIPLIADDGTHAAASNLEFQVEGPIVLAAVSAVDALLPGEPVPLEVWYLNRNDVSATLFETVEAFEGGFDGTIFYASGETPLGNLALGGELGRFVEIPVPADTPLLLAVRVTARTVVNGRTYLDTSVFTVEAEAIPAVSEWGLVVMTLLLLTGIKIKFGRRPSALA